MDLAEPKQERRRPRSSSVDSDVDIEIQPPVSASPLSVQIRISNYQLICSRARNHLGSCLMLKSKYSLPQVSPHCVYQIMISNYQLSCSRAHRRLGSLPRDPLSPIFPSPCPLTFLTHHHRPIRGCPTDTQTGECAFRHHMRYNASLPSHRRHSHNGAPPLEAQRPSRSVSSSSAVNTNMRGLRRVEALSTRRM